MNCVHKWGKLPNTYVAHYIAHAAHYLTHAAHYLTYAAQYLNQQIIIAISISAEFLSVVNIKKISKKCCIKKSIIKKSV